MSDGIGTTSNTYNPIPANAQSSPTTGAGRLAGVTVPLAGTTATIGYAYDALGRVTNRGVDAQTTDLNNVGTTFDALGRVTNVTNALGSFGYGYVDTTARLSSVTYPSGTGLVTDYSYFGNTGDQRLETISNLKSGANVSTFGYTYNAVGTIASWSQQTDTNTATLYTLGYDNADQLISATNTVSGTNTVVNSNNYAYDSAGNRLAETTLSGTTAGQFNNLNQLTAIGSTTNQAVVGNTSAAIASATVNAVPATVSNATNFSATVPLPAGTNILSVVSQNSGGVTQLQQFSTVTGGTAPTSLTYDANGNTLTDEKGNAYTWDALNRLISITYPGGASTDFAYDGLSRRVSIIEKNSSGAVTSTKNYLWIGSEIAEERDASNNVTKRFFPQGEQQSGTNYYYTRDQVGSVREMLNSSGTIVARYSYDPYGRTTLVSGTNISTKQYAGYYYHAASGLNLTEYRAYDANTGRWLSRDPIEEIGGINLYDYVGDEPINRIDPNGLTAIPFPKNPEQAIAEAAVLAGLIIACENNPKCAHALNQIISSAAKAAAQAVSKTTTPCQKKTCPPCTPPVGTIAFRYDSVPPSAPHWPFPGDHVHLYIMNQNPTTCACFWNKFDVVDPSAVPPGSIPMP